MYARLWWKDARQLWPIWVFLAVAAAVAQWLTEKYWTSARSPNALILLAIMWASFYAVAAGAAAFAGEVEAGTLRLLDILPVKRRVAWAGKVSFGLVTALVLTGLLLAMAALGTNRWTNTASTQALRPWDVASLTVIVLEALGWGLFWSALLNSALSAAVAAILCTGISCIFILARLDTLLLEFPDKLRQLTAWQFGIALIATAASNILFTRSGLPKRLRIALRSPIVVVRTGSRHSSPGRLEFPSPGATALLQAAEPRIAQVARAGALTSRTSRPSRRTWLLEARALAWQTAREGWRTWCFLAVIGFLGTVPTILIAGYVEPALLVFASIGIALPAGVSVFGLENRAGTQRFLNHHAARPGLVWLVKLTIWGLGLAAICAPQAILDAMFPAPAYRRGQEILVGLMAFPVAFGVPQLCGMTIRRGITALVAALTLTLALAIPLITGIFMLIVPLSGLLVLPIALLAVSWAWSGDWLRSRPAPGRWVRLGLLLFGAGLLLSVGYASYRVLSVPNISLVAAPESWIEAASAMPPTERNAADLYREAARRLNSQHIAQPAEYLKENSEALNLIRRAAAQPECRFETLDRLTAANGLDLPPMGQLAKLVMLDAGTCQKNGNLGGAWDDLLVLFHMARHLGEGTATRKSLEAWEIERDGLGLAMEWAVAPKQTLERLHAALAAYRALPKMAQAADAVRAEAHLTEKTLSLPADKLRDEILSMRSEHWQAAWVDVITLPWEIARARRVNRFLAAAFFQAAVQEPFQRHVLSSKEFSTPELDYIRQSTPLANLLIANFAPFIESSDRNEVGRRALVQLLALRAWQLRHDGKFPERLEVLVPEELPSLPNDPYTGRPFGYIRSEGQILLSLRGTLRCWLSSGPVAVVRSNLFGSFEPSWKPTPGFWLLYSVGPDLHDDHGRAEGRPLTDEYRQQHGLNGSNFASVPWLYFDLVFPIPPLEGDSAKR
ncbi:MAG: hypothetical protein ACLQIB_40835 [Isosphaeraceae bacterium]